MKIRANSSLDLPPHGARNSPRAPLTALPSFTPLLNKALRRGYARVGFL